MVNQITYTCVSHKGLVRKQNQDNYFCANVFRSEGEKDGHVIQGATSFTNADVFAVFDGLGGEERGDEAALLAAKTLKAHCGPEEVVVAQPSRTGTLTNLCMAMHRSILAYMNREAVKTMGTTVAMVRFREGVMELCNVGDSKIFRMRDHRLVQLTEDHTIFAPGKRKPPLYQYLGWRDQENEFGEENSWIDPYIDSCRCKEGDKYLICSDGLTDSLEESKIADILAHYGGKEMAENLLEESLASGGTDNITAICFEVNEVEKMKDAYDISDIWTGWETEECIGKGAYGAVYRITNRYITQAEDMAVKILSVPLDDSETDNLLYEGMTEENARTYYQALVNDFIHEIELMNLLKDCENIVKIKDYKVIEKEGKVGFDILIRMELLSSLNVFLSDKQLSEAEVLKIGYDLCEALEVCGEHKIIHRDIKPENVFVDQKGNFKLGDFGIAKKMENANASLSQKGTFNYMAPEVICSIDYDARVDIYSLGILLYKLLNDNRLPFVDTKKQLLSPSDRKNALERRIRGEQIPAPKEASEEVAAMILKACAYEPKDRFANAGEMKKAIAKLLGKVQDGRVQAAKATAAEVPVTPLQDKVEYKVVYSESRPEKKGIGKTGNIILAEVAAAAVVLLAGGSFCANTFYEMGRNAQSAMYTEMRSSEEPFEEVKESENEAEEVTEEKPQQMETEKENTDLLEEEEIEYITDSDLKILRTMDTSVYSEEVSRAYLSAKKLVAAGDEPGARRILEVIRNYSDAEILLEECDYMKGCERMIAGDYEGAKALFSKSRSRKMLMAKAECDFRHGRELLTFDMREEAYGYFMKMMEDEEAFRIYCPNERGMSTDYQEMYYDPKGNEYKVTDIKVYYGPTLMVTYFYLDQDKQYDVLEIRPYTDEGELVGFYEYKPDGTPILFPEP